MLHKIEVVNGIFYDFYSSGMYERVYVSVIYQNRGSCPKLSCGVKFPSALM
jgi:hypothetical protein